MCPLYSTASTHLEPKSNLHFIEAPVLQFLLKNGLLACPAAVWSAANFSLSRSPFVLLLLEVPHTPPSSWDGGNQILCLYLWPINYFNLRDKKALCKPAALCSHYFFDIDISLSLTVFLFQVYCESYEFGKGASSFRLILIFVGILWGLKQLVSHF